MLQTRRGFGPSAERGAEAGPKAPAPSQHRSPRPPRLRCGYFTAPRGTVTHRTGDGSAAGREAGSGPGAPTTPVQKGLCHLSPTPPRLTTAPFAFTAAPFFSAHQGLCFLSSSTVTNSVPFRDVDSDKHSAFPVSTGTASRWPGTSASLPASISDETRSNSA